METKSLFLILALLSTTILTACSSGSDSIDKLLGKFSSAPILTSVPDQTLAQEQALHIDINNIKEGQPGNDIEISYVCYYDQVVDGLVEAKTPCNAIPDLTFSNSTGIIDWTPNTGILGNYELKVTGTNSDGSYDEIFKIGVRLNFNGIGLYTQITGTGATMSWTPNLAAVGYQVFKLNTLSGMYELFKSVTGGSQSGTVLTGLTPNTPYTMRVQALDIQGNLDGNVVSRSFTTTELVKIGMTSSSPSGVAGIPVTMTLQVFNADNSPQTVGGLPFTPSIVSGTSSGNFGPVTDNNNGTYTFTFTPNIVGTPAVIEVSTNITFFLNNNITLPISPGAPSSTNSSLSISSGSVVSGSSATVTTNLRDTYNNPIESGVTVAFNKTGGTASGNFSAITNQGNGVYTASFTGITAGTAQTITVVANGVTLTPSTTVAVTPGAPVSSKSNVIIGSNVVPSGTSTLVSAILKDINDNVVPSGVLVAFNKSGGTSSGNFDSVVNQGLGVYTTHYEGVNAGTAQTITVSVDGVTLTPSVTVTVVPGTPLVGTSSLTISSPTVISGAFVTAVAKLKDVNNNPVDSGITVTFSKTGGTSTGTFGTVTNQGNGVYIVRYTGVKSGTAQDINVLINGTTFGSPTSVTVLNGAPSALRSTLTISSSTVISNNDVTINATLKDENDNLISSGYSVSFAKSGGTSTGTLSGFTNAGSGVYTSLYTGLTAGTAQTINVLVDGSALGPVVNITVLIGPAVSANSTLAIASSTVVSGQPVTVSATLRDINNNPVTSGSTVVFSKTGGTSTGTFSSVVNQGNGLYTTTYTGVVAGTAQDIKVNVDGSDLGQTVNVTVLVGIPSAATSTLAISSPNVNSGSAVTVTATVKDLNSNPVTSGVAVTFAKAGGTSTGTFDTITPSAGGIYTTTYTGITAGSAQTLNILVDGFNLGPTVTITVLPGAPSSLLSTMTVSSSTILAGTTATLTATIHDSNNNPISSGVLVGFDKTGGTSFGNFSVVTNQGNGVYTATYFGVTAGSAQTLQTTVNGAGFGPTRSLQVLVGAPHLAYSTFNLSAATVASGSFVTITGVIKDSQNNPITNQYVITFDASGGSSTGDIDTFNNSGTGTFTARYNAITAGSAQTIRVLADGTPIPGLSATVQVTPGPIHSGNSTFTIGSSTVQSGVSTNFAMNLRDSNNNAISSGTTVVTFNKSLGGGVSNGTISSVTNAGSGNYTASYTATTMGSAQNITLVVNGVATTLSVNVTVTAGPPTHFLVSSPGGTINSIDCYGPYTLTFQDSNNNSTSSTSGVSLTLTSAPVNSHDGTIFTDSSCNTNVSSLSLPAYTQSINFYYKSYTPQSLTLTVTPSIASAAANIPILNIAVLGWMGSSAYFTMNGSGSGSVPDNASGGLWGPNDMTVNGDYMYVADQSAHRVLRYNITTNTFAGWIGQVGSKDQLTSFDASPDCGNLAINDVTTKWCLGGRSSSTASLINAPRYVAADSTYLYVSSTNRILRFNKTTGAPEGWIGRIGGTSTTAPAACVSKVNQFTPTWCTGGVSAGGTGDGEFATVMGLTIHSGKLYAADSQQRIQKFNITTGAFEGWMGRVNVAPVAGGQLATCSPLPVTDAKTPGWCSGGTSKVGSRHRDSLPFPNPPEPPPPDEGFYTPMGLANDGTFLYLADANNVRVVRINIVTGAFSGWIGYIGRTTAGVSPMVPAQTAGNYTSTWSEGGVTYYSASSGFGVVNSVEVDTTSSPPYLYVGDGSYQRVMRVRLSDGGDLRWIGRAGGSPQGGYMGCSSTPVGGTTPGWCFGGSGNRTGNTNSAFYTLGGLAATATKLFVIDKDNFRIQRFDKADGTFDGWIGSGNITAPKWQRSYAVGAIPSRLGIDDYSWWDTASYNGVAVSGSYLFQTDASYHRIKKFNVKTGLMLGYIGQIGTFAPTGPEECVGYTSGMTPTWCTGGGRTNSGAGIHGYNTPLGVAADSTYVYIVNYANNRIDRVRITDGLYSGWIGRVATAPTDGTDPSCATAIAGDSSAWCIGGTASGVNNHGSYNNPRAVALDGTTLYVGDASGRIIRTNTSDGAMTGIIGNVTGASGCTVTSNIAQGWCTSATGNGIATTAYGTARDISGITFNSNYIYVADSFYHKIVRFNKSTGAPDGFVGRVAATNIDVSVGTGGPCASLTGFPKPTPGFCKTNTPGQGTTFTASAEENAFSTPKGIWANDSYVYVADTGNHRIVRLDANTGAFRGWKGMIANGAGLSGACAGLSAGMVTPTWCYGGSPGPGLQLGAFDMPTGLSGDANYLYVIDIRNNRTVTLPLE